MKTKHLIPGVCLLAAMTAVGQQSTTSSEVVTIPKQQYEKMMEEHQKLMDEMKEMKSFKAKFEESQKQAVSQQKETDQAFEDMDKQVKAVKQMAKDSFPGTSKFLMTGYGSAGFIYQDHGGDRKFNATFNPIFLWKLSDRLLFEGEIEAELEGHDASFALEMAQLSYVVNDYVTVGAGKFLNPMNYFVERQHMGWVNKLPDKPLAVYDGLLAETEVGFQVRGGVPIGGSKLSYALYVANAPELRTDVSVPTDLGTLEHNNYDNVGKHFAVGGRVGFLPLPELEFGYGFQVSDVAPVYQPYHNGSVSSLLQSVDASYIRELECIHGMLNLKAQWVWSQVDRFDYDPVNLASFQNNRNGGYAQIAYRPTRAANGIIKRLEPVLRYDQLSQIKTLTGVDEERYTVGLNYWLAPMTAVKVAYEVDRQSGPEADRHNAVLMQFVTGF